jgi:hypothetical protein
MHPLFARQVVRAALAHDEDMLPQGFADNYSYELAFSDYSKRLCMHMPEAAALLQAHGQ